MLYEGINEGYTQLLAKRYFEIKKNDYQIETKIAFLLEYVIGSSLMEKAYSTANVQALLDEISKYNGNNLNKASSFLKQIDDWQVINHLPLNEFTFEKLDESIEILRNIMTNLIEMFINKLRLEKINNDIEQFFSQLIYTINAKNENHMILSLKEIVKYKKICYEIVENSKKL